METNRNCLEGALLFNLFGIVSRSYQASNRFYFCLPTIDPISRRNYTRVRSRTFFFFFREALLGLYLGAYI